MHFPCESSQTSCIRQYVLNVIGSKEEIFFDSNAWLDSDSEDDFFSVNGGTSCLDYTICSYFQTSVNSCIFMQILRLHEVLLPSITSRRQRMVKRNCLIFSGRSPPVVSRWAMIKMLQVDSLTASLWDHQKEVLISLEPIQPGAVKPRLLQAEISTTGRRECIVASRAWGQVAVSTTGGSRRWAQPQQTESSWYGVWVLSTSAVILVLNCWILKSVVSLCRVKKDNVVKITCLLPAKVQRDQMPS